MKIPLNNEFNKQVLQSPKTGNFPQLYGLMIVSQCFRNIFLGKAITKKTNKYTETLIYCPGHNIEIISRF